jgi:hypothetical protein
MKRAARGIARELELLEALQTLRGGGEARSFRDVRGD